MSEDSALAAKLTKVYLRITAKKAEITSELKAKEADLNEQLDKVRNALLKYCKDHELESVKTSEGLFYRTVKTRYSTSDWDEMNKFILEHNVPEFYEKRLNQTHVRQFLEENPDVVPPRGFSTDSQYTITVRKKR